MTEEGEEKVKLASASFLARPDGPKELLSPTENAEPVNQSDLTTITCEKCGKCPETFVPWVWWVLAPLRPQSPHDAWLSKEGGNMHVPLCTPTLLSSC